MSSVIDYYRALIDRIDLIQSTQLVRPHEILSNLRYLQIRPTPDWWHAAIVAFESAIDEKLERSLEPLKFAAEMKLTYPDYRLPTYLFAKIEQLLRVSNREEHFIATLYTFAQIRLYDEHLMRFVEQRLYSIVNDRSTNISLLILSQCLRLFSDMNMRPTVDWWPIIEAMLDTNEAVSPYV